MGMRRKWLLAVPALAAAYALVSYLLLPEAFLLRDEARPVAPMLTRTSDDLPGGPINVAIEGDRAALFTAMHDAGWAPADPITFDTSLAIIGSVALDRPDQDAPVSALFYDGRREDFAFEKEAGASADKRQHVRFWHTGQEDDRPRFLGAVSFDEGVGVSHYTGQVTHRIDPDIDAARQALAADLGGTGRVESQSFIEGRGATDHALNGEGDPYHTDGLAVLLELWPSG